MLPCESTNFKNIYVCQFLHKDGTCSVPMALFTNEKAAKEYTNRQNEEGDVKWYYYKMEAYTTFWWDRKRESI